MASRFIMPQADVGTGISPSDGAQLFFFDTGTSNKKPIYSNSTGTERSNPVIADGNGVFPEIWIVGTYKVVLKDKNGRLTGFREADPVFSDGATTDVARNFPTIASAKADDELEEFIGGFVDVAEYTVGKPIIQQYKIVAAGTGTDDGGEFHDSTTAGLFQLQLIPKAILHAFVFGIKGDGTDEIVQMTALKDYQLSTGLDAIFTNSGSSYNVDDANMPWRNTVTVSPTLEDFKGMTLFCGAGVVFKTTSVNGADVFQLNAMDGFNIIGYPGITATVSGSQAGSNAVSVTNGGKDIYVEANPFSMPGLDKGPNIDGGKGFTMQNGATATNNFTNVKLKGKVDDCAFAFNAAFDYDEFDIGLSPIFSGIEVDIIGENCWVGVSMGAAAATVTFPATEKDIGIKVNATLINCAQILDLQRWIRADVNVHVVNTKTKVNLFRPLASDQLVYGMRVLGDYHSNVKFTGTMVEVDNKLIIGGTTQGGGVVGASDGLTLDFELDSTTVVDTEIDVINSGGNTIKNSVLRLSKNVVASLPASTLLLIAANNNNVTLGPNLTGSFTGTMTGLTTSPTGTIKYSMKGDVVVMEIPIITGTSNSTFTTISGILTDVRPITAQTCVGVAEDNGTKLLIRITVATSGTITLYKTPGTSGSWTASGTKSIQASTITYRKS